MSEKRPWFSSTTQELEEIFRQNRGDREVLLALKNELAHRKRPRARRLLEQVVSFLDQELLVAMPEPARSDQAELPLKRTHNINLEKPEPPAEPKPQERGLLQLLRDLVGAGQNIPEKPVRKSRKKTRS